MVGCVDVVECRKSKVEEECNKLKLLKEIKNKENFVCSLLLIDNVQLQLSAVSSLQDTSAVCLSVAFFPCGLSVCLSDCLSVFFIFPCSNISYSCVVLIIDDATSLVHSVYSAYSHTIHGTIVYYILACTYIVI